MKEKMQVKKTKSMMLKLNERFYGNKEHPYKTYEKAILRILPENAKVLDAGCGHTAPVISKIAPMCNMAIGMDVTTIEPNKADQRVHFLATDLHTIGLQTSCLDMVISRSVLEHIRTPLSVLKEVNRILKPGGHFIFLTPNLYDYASVISKIIPNRFHTTIVKITEGRDESDTFPTHYRTNTARDISRLAKDTGFEVLSLVFLGQYPAYLMFNPILFLVGTAYDRLLCAFDALSFLRGWILCVLRKP